jgi:hypothetical protein
MWIRRLEVVHWRGLSWTLEGLAPGLNLIAGPNEAGKSRLVQALRFALFESTKGRSEHKRALATWGVAPERPRVVVDFELAGVEWHVEKVFLGTGCNTQLRGGGRTLDGEAAEERLAQLLGVTPGRSTELRPEDRGLWALLWVDQGQSREQPVHSEASQSRLLDQLSREIGEAAAGATGQRLLARAEAEFGRFFSTANGRPLKTLTDPEQQVAELRTRLAAAIERRDTLAQTAAALAAARDREQDQATRVGLAETRLAEASARFDAAQALAHRLELAAGEVRVAEQQLDQARSLREAAATLDADSQRLRADLAAAEQRLIDARETCATRQQAVTEAAAGIVALEAQISGCDQRIARARLREQRHRQREELARLRARLADAHTVDARITERRLALAALPAITPHEAAALRKAESARNTARARLDGASVALTLSAVQPLQIDGEPLAAGATRRLLVHEDHHIDVAGVLTLTVNPGAGEIVRLREALHDAERVLATQLAQFAQVAELGIADADAGEQAARQRHEIEREIERATEELGRLVPEGVAELGRAVAAIEVALEMARAAPAEDPAGAGARPESSAMAPADAEPDAFNPEELRSAETEANTLNVALQEARRRRDADLERLAQAREAQAALIQQLDTDRGRLARLAAQRGELPDAAALTGRVNDAERNWAERIAARDQIQRQFEASGGASLALDLEQARRAAQQLRDLQQRTVAERIELTGELRGASNQALHETVQDLEAELVEVEGKLARVSREAAAARRLYEVLTREHQAARERLTGPVVERIRPYLADLFPGSAVWLDDELGLRGLRSETVDESFDELSGGAREQLSLLVRIGLAEVLCADESWPLVLDDVLVNTDAARIRQMQRALYHAGRRMQILLFTCHGALFDALGPDAWIELPPSRR